MAPSGLWLYMVLCQWHRKTFFGESWTHKAKGSTMTELSSLPFPAQRDAHSFYGSSKTWLRNSPWTLLINRLYFQLDFFFLFNILAKCSKGLSFGNKNEKDSRLTYIFSPFIYLTSSELRTLFSTNKAGEEWMVRGTGRVRQDKLVNQSQNLSITILLIM